MKKAFIILIMVWPFLPVRGQITIENSDMPNENQSFLISQSADVSIDPDQSGPNFLWDFSDLMVLAQDTVSFISVDDVAFNYQLVFNNPFNPSNVATEVEVINAPGIIEGIEVDEAFSFTKTEGDKKELIGLGAGINGVSIPLAFEDNKLVYTFPLNFGQSATDTYNYAIEVPGLGYLSQDAVQSYDVDGWGTLVTSFGTFEVLRIKRIINQHDSIYLNSTGMGLAVDRVLTQYEWLGKNTGIPLMAIETEFGLINSIVFQDNLIVTDVQALVSINEFSVYPQPVRDVFYVGFDRLSGSEITVSIFDLSGKQVFRKEFTPALRLTIEPQLSKGIYLIEVQSGDFQNVKKLVVQ